ncbi:2TM domain-containing protein [Mesorhizobium sp. WSM4904]|uniref:2TM domain-containing protein n=1 Tax=Mesorhizobium sp. WSM4904 TaxID=3038545 RepID=UPI0024189BD7|nr:2TM domain-containing protein [Mesorhizobium sp. WSM4904]WFP61946.1 2TM domain-containing protein [Mesorhizobium sp. WSM4904]
MQTSSDRQHGFQIHAFVFAVGIVAITALNLYLGKPYWFYWSLLGWGIGIVAHWWFVLGPGAKPDS